MHMQMTKNLFTPKVPILIGLIPSQHPKFQHHNTHSSILNLNTQNCMDKLSMMHSRLLEGLKYEFK
jgi:hypothetical protein